ncbi:hypothetical protein ACJJTC_015658 [Scirpophaga incertulas]
MIAKAFDPSTTSLSERRYRIIKNKILKWPFRTSFVICSTPTRQASSFGIGRVSARQVVSSGCRKRPGTSTPAEVPQSKRAAPAQNHSDTLLVDVLNKQVEMFNKLLTSQENLNESFESFPDSTNMGEEIEIASCSANSSTKRSATSSEKNILMKQIVEAQRKLATLQNGDLEEVATEFDFSPYTIERESKVGKS